MTANVKAKGRTESFEALLGPVLVAAYRMAINLTNNEGDAEDLVQNAALLAFRSFDSFEQGTNFKAWFFKILTNCFLMEIRKQKRRPASVELDRLQEGYLYSRSKALGWHDELEDPARYFRRGPGRHAASLHL